MIRRLLFILPLSALIIAVTASACYSQNYSVFPVGDRYILLRDTGHVTDTLYTEMSDIVEGYLWVNKGDLYGFIDTGGNEITGFIYDEVSSFSNERARVGRDSMFGFINKKGIEAIPVIYDEATLFRNSLASVRKGNKWFLIDTSGTMIYDHGFDHPASYHSIGFIGVSVNNRWGVINFRGELIYPFEFDLVSPDGRAWRDGKMLFLY